MSTNMFTSVSSSHQTTKNTKYVESHLHELATLSQSKENIICTVGMIYDYCTTNKKSLDEVTFPCKMKMNFTYNSNSLSVEIEPLRKTHTRPLGGVVFPMLSISYTPNNKEKLLQYMERVLR